MSVAVSSEYCLLVEASLCLEAAERATVAESVFVG